MAESVTIARPYAEAVFRMAREAGALAAWSDKLRLLAAVARDAEMTAVVGNPKFSAEQVAQLFIAIVGAAGDKELGNLIRVLAENERLAALPEISGIYEQLKSAEEGVKEALVESAYPIDDAQLKNLTSQLEAHFGTRLQPRVAVQPELIGGIKVVVGDRVLDASVRGKLEAMATVLKN